MGSLIVFLLWNILCFPRPSPSYHQCMQMTTDKHIFVINSRGSRLLCMSGLSKTQSSGHMYTHSTCSRLHPFSFTKRSRERRRRSKDTAKCAWKSEACHHAVHLPCQQQPQWCFSLWRRAKHPLSCGCAPHKLKLSLCQPLLSWICAHVLWTHKNENYEVEGFFFLPPFFVLLQC